MQVLEARLYFCIAFKSLLYMPSDQYSQETYLLATLNTTDKLDLMTDGFEFVAVATSVVHLLIVAALLLYVDEQMECVTSQ